MVAKGFKDEEHIKQPGTTPQASPQEDFINPTLHRKTGCQEGEDDFSPPIEDLIQAASEAASSN